ncbi:uncharacterized protein LKV04_015703 [Tautogolabrus adspersus]
MLYRNVLLLFSVFVLLVEADLDTNNTEIQGVTTDKDSTSSEAPTEPAVTAANTSEKEDEDESFDSDEGGKKNFRAKSQIPAHNPSSTFPHQPIIPQPKAAVRNRTSKRRSRTNRRQI